MFVSLHFNLHQCNLCHFLYKAYAPQDDWSHQTKQQPKEWQEHGKLKDDRDRGVKVRAGVGAEVEAVVTDVKQQKRVLEVKFGDQQVHEQLILTHEVMDDMYKLNQHIYQENAL